MFCTVERWDGHRLKSSGFPGYLFRCDLLSFAWKLLPCYSSRRHIFLPEVPKSIFKTQHLCPRITTLWFGIVRTSFFSSFTPDPGGEKVCTFRKNQCHRWADVSILDETNSKRKLEVRGAICKYAFEMMKQQNYIHKGKCGVWKLASMRDR